MDRKRSFISKMVYMNLQHCYLRFSRESGIGFAAKGIIAERKQCDIALTRRNRWAFTDVRKRQVNRRQWLPGPLALSHRNSSPACQQHGRAQCRFRVFRDVDEHHGDRRRLRPRHYVVHGVTLRLGSDGRLRHIFGVSYRSLLNGFVGYRST